jgi:MFS family permease
MTLLYRVFPPHIYIAICVASWGLIASLQSIATSFPALLVLRAFLGISEAAFGPGVPFYLSFFYKRDELAFRTGLFISAAPLATSFASSLAWAITKAGGAIPIAPWRMLFLIEGFPSIVVAVFAWYYIPDSPGTARYLKPRLRQVAKIRLRAGKDAEKAERKSGLRWKEIGTTLTDPKCYLTAVGRISYYCSSFSYC